MLGDKTATAATSIKFYSLIIIEIPTEIVW